MCIWTSFYAWKVLYNSTLVFTSYLCNNSKSTRFKRLRPFQLFSLVLHTTLHLCITFLKSQEHFRAFKSPYVHPIARFFFFNFCQSLFYLSGNTTSNSCNVKQFLVILFDKLLVDRTVCTEWIHSQVR